jgi:peptidoglycan L-alanyl-D-glutamate endopeptidase CwlK
MSFNLEAGTDKRLGWLRAWAKKEGIAMVVTSTFRDARTQDMIYAQGRTIAGGIVTYAQGWQSWHNVGRAFDIAFFNGKKVVYDGPFAPWAKVVEKAKSIGLTWGGTFKRKDRKTGKMVPFQDKPHFQYEFDGTGVKHSLKHYVDEYKATH